MTRYVFQQVHATQMKTGTCPVCGKHAARSQRFTQTVNPWNKNPDGSVKTYDEVGEAVSAEARAWEPDFTHKACRYIETPKENDHGN